MTLNSVSELEKLIKDNICVEDLSEECYSKTIYVEQATMDNLIKYELDFQPYMDIAKKSLLQSIQIMKSTHTNIFYIGFDSLKTMKLLFEIENLGYKLSKKELYENPIIRDFIKLLQINEEIEIIEENIDEDWDSILDELNS